MRVLVVRLHYRNRTPPLNTPLVAGARSGRTSLLPQSHRAVEHAAGGGCVDFVWWSGSARTPRATGGCIVRVWRAQRNQNDCPPPWGFFLPPPFPGTTCRAATRAGATLKAPTRASPRLGGLCLGARSRPRPPPHRQECKRGNKNPGEAWVVFLPSLAHHSACTPCGYTPMARTMHPHGAYVQMSG